MVAQPLFSFLVPVHWEPRHCVFSRSDGAFPCVVHISAIKSLGHPRYSTEQQRRIRAGLFELRFA